MTQKINKYVKKVKCEMVVSKSSTIFILEIYVLLPCKHFPETRFLTSYSTLNCSFGNVDLNFLLTLLQQITVIVPGVLCLMLWLCMDTPHTAIQTLGLFEMFLSPSLHLTNFFEILFTCL